jgi:hypothetical protein
MCNRSERGCVEPAILVERARPGFRRISFIPPLRYMKKAFALNSLKRDSAVPDVDHVAMAAVYPVSQIAI